MKVVIIVALFVPACLGWWDAGHATAAEIARLEVKDVATRDVIDRILAADNATLPKFSSWGMSATFPDYLKAQKMNGMSSWHYIDYPIVREPWHGPNPPPTTPIDANLEDSIYWVTTSLNATTDIWAAAYALRYLFHLVGDMHQPLHCSALFTDQFNFPDGDMGGNRFLMSYTPYDGIKNLHSFWDSCAGLYSDGADHAKEIAQDLIKEFPDISQYDLDPNWDAIMHESFHAASDFVYKGIEFNMTLDNSSEYTQNSQKLCKLRIRLAGARLARALDLTQIPARFF